MQTETTEPTAVATEQSVQMSEPTLYFIDDDTAIVDAVSQWAKLQNLAVRAFASAEEFLAADDICSPGCIVAGLRMPGLSGLDLQAKLQQRGEKMPLIMISGHSDVESAISAFKQGATDFLTKPIDPASLMRRVCQCFDADQQRVEAEREAALDQGRYDTLTPREQQVFGFLIRGLAGKQIAQELGISYRTVEKFRGKVIQKMEVESIAALVHTAFRIGHLSSDT